jgi:hypothetical protein
MSEKLTVEDLRDDIKYIGRLIISSRETLQNFKLIASYNKEIKISRQYEGFLIHYMTLGWSMCSINLCKILRKSDNEKRSFIKLLNKLENRRYDDSIVNLLNENKALNKNRTAKSHEDIKEIISKCREKISENKLLITKISNRRDKVYGHGYYNKDKDSELTKLETRNELSQLVDLAFYLYDQIFGEIFGKFWPEETKLHSIEPILKSMRHKN